jgi:hypothetical protein
LRYLVKWKMEGLELIARDRSWSVAEGLEVGALMSTVLLLSAGRLAVLPWLSGKGAFARTARLWVLGGMESIRG